MSTLITLAALAALAGFVYHYMPKDRPGKLFRLEQFRPAAPLAGIFDEGADASKSDGRPDTNPIQTEDMRSSNRALD
ncbi:hypothetical protein LCL87_08920 [Rhodococcus hoagii]|nr:hypothetical protein [Prescottella equi]